MIHLMKYNGDQTLAYAESGHKDGFPILIQHGLIASITETQLFERLIRLGLHLICMARPGYGQSSPYKMKNIGEWGEIVAVLVSKLHLSRFDVLGMSSGAPYSYAIGYKLPEQARNIFIFSGIPALYDDQVLSAWPYPSNRGASLAEMQKLAYDLFFSNLSAEDLERDDIQDSMMNDCFGITQDLRIRCLDWGFTLGDVKQRVFMEHSWDDTNIPFITAEMTSRLMPNCNLINRESGGHFSPSLLDDFIDHTMSPHY